MLCSLTDPVTQNDQKRIFYTDSSKFFLFLFSPRFTSKENTKLSWKTLPPKVNILTSYDCVKTRDHNENWYATLIRIVPNVNHYITQWLLGVGYVILHGSLKNNRYQGSQHFFKLCWRLALPETKFYIFLRGVKPSDLIILYTPPSDVKIRF